jgi:hypothetical protein
MLRWFQTSVTGASTDSRYREPFSEHRPQAYASSARASTSVPNAVRIAR